MSMKLYVGATGQNDGKTTTALGLFDLLRDHFPSIGYMKPVGPKVRLIGESNIDKDASLMEEVFRIGTPLRDMNPVTVPRGFTESFILDGDTRDLRAEVLGAYRRASAGKEFMVIEGTGNAGVGAVLDLSNADVARILDAPVVITTVGGIGRSIDEVMLNKALYDSRGVTVLGVIINKVLLDKYDRISNVLRAGFRRKGVDVLGVMPFAPVLSRLSIRQLLEDVRGELIAGERNIDATASRIVVGAMPPQDVLGQLNDDVLLLAPGNREDLLLLALACRAPEVGGACGIRGIVLTGGTWPGRRILDLVRAAQIPTIVVSADTFTAALTISGLIIKIRPEDADKIDAAKDLIRRHVDAEALLRKLRAYGAHAPAAPASPPA